MGYKRIPAAIHNFGHSFASLMNYHDDEYIIDILARMVPKLPESELSIKFPGGKIEPPREMPKPLLDSVAYYDQHLPRHLSNEGVSPDCITEVRLVVTSSRRGLCY
ncbi:MAG: hypothetical protein HY289_11675 [Planctomycetes bacterium]|nr:hypothetical protein [Planctomycetota bacterium]